MRADTRRKIEMGRRTLDFSRAHPSTSVGHATAVTRLQELLGRADELFARQRDGILQERTATQSKRELRRTITQGHLNHLVHVARAAGVAPDLERRFQLTTYNGSFLAFRNEAKGIAAEAAASRELLAQYGLDEVVLEDLDRALARLDASIEQGDAGRRLHITATAGLLEVADEVVAVVGVLTGINRVRFAKDEEAMTAWERASSVFAADASGKAAPEREKPAA
jgi:hypothetical protein